MPPSIITRGPGHANASRSSTGHVSDVVTESQETPLNAIAVAKINDLKTVNQKALSERINAALRHIIDATDLINNRGYEDRVKHSNKKRKVNEDDDEPSDDQQIHERLQEQIQLTTKRLDLSIRKVIDDRVWLENIPDALDHVSTKSTAVATRAIRPPRATHDDETPDDNEEGDQDEIPLLQPDPSENSTALLHAALSTYKTTRNSKSLTQRYASDNDYRGFKRVVWESNNQGDNAPPVPHASLWFAAEEGRDTRPNKSNQRNHQTTTPSSTQNMISLQSTPSDSGSDSDIEIRAEHTRTTCPITLRPFTDPVTSTKCPHSFERQAITTMLNESKSFVPYTQSQLSSLNAQPNPQARSKLERQLRTPMIQCPECVMQLTQNDLRPDAALLRKTTRIQERKRREEEADERRGQDQIIDADDVDDDEDELPRLSQRKRIVNLGSSPARSLHAGSARKSIKSETRRTESMMRNEIGRESIVPQTQLDGAEDIDPEEEYDEDDDDDDPNDEMDSSEDGDEDEEMEDDEIDD